MTFRQRFFDLAGELGTSSTARLGRIIWEGGLNPGSSFTVPTLNFTATPPTWSGNGVVLVGQGVGGFRIWHSGVSPVTWNNTTKVVANPSGAVQQVLVVLWADTPPSGEVFRNRIVNSAGEMLIDNEHPNLEVVAEGTITPNKGSTFSITQPSGYGILTTFIRWGINTDFIIMGSGGRGYVGFVNGGFGTPFPIDYKVCARNPTTSRGSGGPGFVMAVYRPSDGQCLFSSRRKYARIRTALPIEQTDFFDGGTGGASFYYHNTVPSNCYLSLQPSYRLAGDLGCGYIRATTGQLTSALLNGFTSGQATTIGIITLPSYPGAWMNSHLVLNP